jgi:hypothetical protein
MPVVLWPDGQRSLSSQLINVEGCMLSPRVPKVTSSAKQNRAKPIASERRIQPRFTTQFRSTFSGKHEEGQGRTLDLSLGGCKIESDTVVMQGETFECRLHVPGFDWPLRIDETTVRWIAGNTFGLAFISLRPEEQAKLTIVINNLQESE